MHENMFLVGSITRIGQRSEQALAVRAGHPLLEEHFPGFPIVPGSMTVSMVLDHARALLGPAATLGSAVFLRPVRAEEDLVLSTSIGEGELRFILRQGSHAVCRGAVRAGKGNHDV